MNADDQAHERLVKEYESTISMLRDTGQTVWVINGSYLLAETVMLGLLAQGLGSAHDVSSLLVLGSVLGFVISIFWWASFERAYAFYNLRMNFARELEAPLGYRVVSKGKDLSDGEKVRVGERDIRIPAFARWLSIQDWTRGLIAVFALTFIGIFAFSIGRYTRWPAPILLASQAGTVTSAPAAPLVVTVVEIASSVVIAAFAVLQWLLFKRAEASRQAEREADRLERTDTAYATVNAEYFRIWTVSQQWAAVDLTSAAVVATMSPEDILPRDWPSFTQDLAQLGYLPARIGGFGLALAHDACRHARALFAEAVAYDQQRPTDAEAAAAFEKKHVPRLRDAETKLKELATEAANVLEDALEHAPPFKLLRQPPVWNEVLHSKYTQQMKAQVDAQLGLPAAAGITEPALPIEPPQLDSTLLQAQLDEERQAPLRQLASLARSLLASLRKLPGPAQQGAADSIIRAAVLPEDDELRELRRLAANIGPALAQQAQAVTDNFGWLLQWARQVQATSPSLGFDYKRFKWPEWGFRWTEAEQALKKLGAT